MMSIPFLSRHYGRFGRIIEYPAEKCLPHHYVTIYGRGAMPAAPVRAWGLIGCPPLSLQLQRLPNHTDSLDGGRPRYVGPIGQHLVDVAGISLQSRPTLADRRKVGVDDLRHFLLRLPTSTRSRSTLVQLDQVVARIIDLAQLASDAILLFVF